MSARKIRHVADLKRRLDAIDATLNYAQLTRIANGDFEQIRVTYLRALCIALECTPNDLFGFTDVAATRSKLQQTSRQRTAVTRVRVDPNQRLGKLGAIRPLKEAP